MLAANLFILHQLPGKLFLLQLSGINKLCFGDIHLIGKVSTANGHRESQH